MNKRPPKARQRPDGTFDLGLTLFHLAEKYGQKFGDEELDDGGAASDDLASQRAREIECAQIVVQAIANDDSVGIALRARAFFLAGNL